jgi:hypothetical protein
MQGMRLQKLRWKGLTTKAKLGSHLTVHVMFPSSASSVMASAELSGLTPWCRNHTLVAANLSF